VVNLLREYIRALLVEKDVLAIGMCFPFAHQKAVEWFEAHYEPPADPEDDGKKHPDLNNKDKFKVVHGTVTDKWKKPPKPVVHGWVEMGDLVFDDQTKITKPNGVDKEFYYDMFQPVPSKEFTAEEAINNCIMYGGEGPWDEDLYTQLQKRDAWLKEGVEFRTLDSPLTYNRAGNVKRIALCDTSVKEPNPRRDAYFNEYQEMERYGASGRRLKKPRKGKLVPGVSDDCVIGFLDYHQQAKNSDGSTYWYIDYMKTRGDKGGKGTASKLIDEFYNTVAQPGDNVHFGKMMQPQVGHLKDKMVDKYPEIDTIGAKYF